MCNHPQTAGGGVLLAITGIREQPVHAAGNSPMMLVQFKLSNLTGQIRQLTVIADASDARGSFIASASRTLTVIRHAEADGELAVTAPPDGSILLSVRENGGTLHTSLLSAPLLPFQHDKEE